MKNNGRVKTTCMWLTACYKFDNSIEIYSGIHFNLLPRDMYHLTLKIKDRILWRYHSRKIKTILNPYYLLMTKVQSLTLS